VTFASPLVLLVFLLVPVAIARYVAGERARGRRAREFANPRLMPSLAPVRPGWRRHLPLALYALALAVLIVAAARPRTTVAVPVENATVMLLTDVSGSMQATDVHPTRLIAARQAALTFVGRVPRGVRIGVMAFNQHPRTLQPPTADHNAARTALGQLASSGVGGKRPPAAIVLLSDGKSTSGEDPRALATRAARDNIPIYTVALGTPAGTIRVPRTGGAGGYETRSVPPDPTTLTQIAGASRGQAYTAEDSEALSTVYHRLGHQLGTRKAPREITAGFVGGAVALLAIAGALSLRWFGRLP